MPSFFTEKENKNLGYEGMTTQGVISSPPSKNIFIAMPAKLNQTVAKTNNQSSLQCCPEMFKRLYFFFDIVARSKEDNNEKDRKKFKAEESKHPQSCSTCI